ncbi:efflux transporter outer membrane subunit [Nitrospira sp. CMX1]
MRTHVLAAVLVSTVLRGCAVWPDYREPVINAPAAFVEALRQNVANDTTALAEWWTTFPDEELTSLVQRTIANNLDVQIAEGRLQEARASLRYTSANTQLPTVNLEGKYSRNKISTENPAIPKLGAGTLIPTSYGYFQSFFDASYELDLFGGVRRQVEASAADAQSYEDSLRNTLVSTIAEVAKDYLQLRQYQEQLAVPSATETSRRDTLKITQVRYKAGLATDLDVANAAASLASTHASIPTLQSSAGRMIRAIAVLLGQNPDDLTEELQATHRIPAAPPEIPVGLPSDLLRRRPDIRQAERSLAAATARVGVQVAKLFPSISLTAQYGIQAGNVLSLTQAAAGFYTLGPQIKWGLLNYPATKASIRTYEARRDQQYLTYQKTVLTAFQDVENALSAYGKEKEAYSALEEEVRQYDKAASIAMTRYTQGLSNFLDVLDAQRSLYTAQDALVQSRAALAIDLIALYKALGRGWEHNDLVAHTVQRTNVKE